MSKKDFRREKPPPAARYPRLVNGVKALVVAVGVTSCGGPLMPEVDAGKGSPDAGNVADAGLAPGTNPKSVECDRRFISEGLRIRTPPCFSVSNVELDGTACDKVFDAHVGGLVWVMGKAEGTCRVTLTYANGENFSTDGNFTLVRDSLCGDYFRGTEHVTAPGSCPDSGQ